MIDQLRMDDVLTIRLNMNRFTLRRKLITQNRRVKMFISKTVFPSSPPSAKVRC